MAVQVILDFESDQEAKAFVSKIIEDGCASVQTGEDAGGDMDHGVYPVYTDFDCTVVGAFKRATKFCTCANRTGWTRGRGYGWWVCDNCRLPTEKWTDNADRWRYALGINLVPAESGGIQPKPGERGDHDLDSPKIWRDLPARTSQEA
jgi:hypothetical protein